MKQNRLTLLVICVVVFLAFAEAHAQSPVDGQPSVLKEDNGQSNYVYDLKLLIKKSKDNIKGVNEKIKEQAVVKRNQQREQKAREYYEQALKLQAEGRLEEAHQLFDKAIRITEHPEMKYYIKESEHRSKLQQAALQRADADQDRRANEEQKLLIERAENSYQTAVTLYKQQKFREAKDEFMLTEELYPDYKAVRSYLQIIEQDIIQSEHLDMKEQKKEIERQQKEEDIARLREKELWRKEVDKKEEERQQQLRKQAQTVYEDALRLFDERKYSASRDKFQEVEWVIPDYKATRAYLTRIENSIQDEKKQFTQERQRELEKQRWQEALAEKRAAEERRKAFEQREQEKLLQVKDQAEFVYVAAVALFEKDLLEQSREKFDEVQALYPNYKSTADYLKRIAQVFGERTDREVMKKKTDAERLIWEEELEARKQEKEKLKILAAEADGQYDEAMLLYQTGRLIEAKEKFLAVDERVPDYKSTRSYLKRIDADIEFLVKTGKVEDSLAAQREELDKMRMMRDKAEAVYMQAMSAYDAKDFSAAKVKFQETAVIYPDYKKTAFYLNRIDEGIRLKEEASSRMDRERQADAMYVQAFDLYGAAQFEEAKKKFLAVETIVPGYKNTEDFLGRIDDDILNKKEADLLRLKEERVKSLYDQGIALLRNGQLSDAKDKFFEVEVLSPGYKDAGRILKGIDADIQNKKKEVVEQQEAETAESLYKQALALYLAGDYASAKEKFIKTEVARPDYKDVTKYLGRIDADILRKKNDDALRAKTAEVEPVYSQAVEFYKNADFIEAKKKFLVVQAIFPGYKEIDFYLARVDKDIRDQEIRLVKEERTRRSDLLYSEAVKLYTDRRFVEAREKFVELSGVDPAYKNLRAYLARIDQDIRQETAAQQRLLAQEQAAEPYAQGVTLYHDGDLKAAREKFMEVARSMPDYKKTRSYLTRIDADLRAKKVLDDKERDAKAEVLYKEAAKLMADDKILEAYTKLSNIQTFYPEYKSLRANMERLRKLGKEKGLDLPEPLAVVPEVSADEAQVVVLYKEAVQLYKDKKYDDARLKFEAVEKISLGYRSTRQYLDSIIELKDMGAAKRRPEVKPESGVVVPEVASIISSDEAVKTAVVTKPEVKDAPVTLSEEEKTVAKMSARSNAIYQQIKSLSEDKELTDASRTFAKVDRLIENLEVERRRIAERISREKKIAEENALRLKRAEEQKYSVERVNALREKAEDKVQKEIQSREADLAREREELRKKERRDVDALKDQARETRLKVEVLYQQASVLYREKNYDLAKERLVEVEKLSADYKDAARLMTRVERGQDEVKIVAQENKDRENIRALAEKAAALNIEILQLSENRDYLSVEQKFNDLESILKEIQLVKNTMVDRRSEFESRWEKKASDSRAVAKKAAAPKTVREGEDFISPAQKARLAFKEGQQLYAAENFAEARVKFMDALHMDSSFKAPMSYVIRIDRILSKKDFEVRQEQDKVKARDIGNKEKSVAPDLDDSPTGDPGRALAVSAEGVNLYQAKRYREARIKFEELLQIGNAADQQKAARYLKLIEQALDKEKKAAEAEQRAQEERYLEERRTQAKLALERDKKQQERERRQVRELAATQRELDIRRQQDLRMIEDENLKQRREMLEKKNAEMSRALNDDAAEYANFSSEAAQTRLPRDVKVAEKVSVKEKAEAARTQKQYAPAVIDQMESPSQEKIDASPSRAERRLMKGRKKEEARSDSNMEQQRRKFERQESKEEREQRLAQEALIARNQKEVQAILNDAASLLPSEPVSAVVIPPPPAVLEEDPAALLLKQAAQQEQLQLSSQRALIRKDFEEGVERLYVEAVGLFKKKMYAEAREDFEQVDALIKDYKKTAQYLKETERFLSRSGR